MNTVKISIIYVYFNFLQILIQKNQRTNGPVKRSPDIWAKHKIWFKMAQSFLRKARFSFQM